MADPLSGSVIWDPQFTTGAFGRARFRGWLPMFRRKLPTFEPFCGLLSLWSERDPKGDLGFEDRDSRNVGEEWAVQDLNL